MTPTQELHRELTRHRNSETVISHNLAREVARQLYGIDNSDAGRFVALGQVPAGWADAIRMHQALTVGLPSSNPRVHTLAAYLRARRENQQTGLAWGWAELIG